MISILILLFGLSLASCGAILVSYSKDGAQESLGGFVAIVGSIFVAIGGIARVYGI